VLTLPLLWGGLLCAWLGVGVPLDISLAGVVAGYTTLTLLRGLCWWWFGMDGMNAGDVKLLAAVGAWTGVYVVADVLLLACLASVAFATVHQRRLLARGAYPFGPFMAGSTMTVFFQPNAVHSWFWA